MNRKLLVIAMVPLLVGFAGALAFSTYQGTMTKTFTANTGEVKVFESVECVGAYVVPHTYVVLKIGDGDPLTWTGDDHGQIAKCPSVPECHIDPCGGPGGPVIAGPVEYLGPGVASGSLSITIQYMAPGDWFEFLLVDTAWAGPGYLPAELTSALSAGPGLYGTVTGSPLAFTGTNPLALGFAAAKSGGWTWLSDPANLCAGKYILSPGAIDVSSQISTAPAIGLEYCTSGDLASTSAPNAALSPPTALGPGTSGAVPFTIGSAQACTYLLIGFDHSADDSMMGASGTLTYTTYASSP